MEEGGLKSSRANLMKWRCDNLHFISKEDENGSIAIHLHVTDLMNEIFKVKAEEARVECKIGLWI